jgi:glycosyltransferase involved in cell wall biosynthesis
MHYAKKYNKKSIVVASGYDVANEPEINYGLSTRFYTKWIPKYILDRADKVLAVSKCNLEETKRLTKNPNIELVYNGIDINKYPKVQNKKEDMIITVGFLDKKSWKRKGIDKFINTAIHFPDIPFIVIGKITDFAKEHIKYAPYNTTFTGYLSDEKLLEYYQRAKVYAQFSFYGSFGMAVAEAMLCNCIPVVSNRGGLPEIVGDSGITVDYDINSFVDGIKTAMEMSLTNKPRDWIISNFSLEKRERELVKIIEELK